MGNSHRDAPRPDPAVTPNSAAFQAWLSSRGAVSAAPADASSGAAPGSGRWGSGGSSGSGGSGGSGCGGYGLALISSDEASQERIKAIMRDICAREQKR